MSKFKVGQTVRLIKNNGMAAEIGATAKVTRLGILYLYVEWLTTDSRSQDNGGYSYASFEPVQGQLQFSFMYDEVNS